MREIILKDYERSITENVFGDFVKFQLSNGRIIERVEDLIKDFNDASGINLHPPEARKILRDQLGMRYSKII
jgi:hypothetical protein